MRVTMSCLRQTRHFMRTCGHFGLATVAAGMPVVEAFGAANGGPVDREDLLAIPMNPGSAVKTERWTSRPSSIVALQHRDFRLLWLGLLISFSGSTMQTTAILWHVSVLVPAEQRGLALGFVGLVRVGPVMVFSLLSGVAAD